MYYILFVTFLSHVTLFSMPKKQLHIVRNKIKKNRDNRLKNIKLIQSQKNAQKLRIFSLKMLGFLKTHKTILNKDTEHKKNYMEGLNSKNKIVKCGGSP